jgi:archaemetzincin
MRRLLLALLPPLALLLIWLALPPEAPAEADPADPLEALIAALEPLALPLPEPGPSDWLANYPEAGQSYAEWSAVDPVVATAARRSLVVQPIGSFEPAQRQVMELAAEWLGLFFGLPCRLEEDLGAEHIPSGARRVHPRWGGAQVHAPTLLYDLLLPRLPEDALALIGFTGEDLYPEESWNFVFGMALLRERTGVWSMHRFGDPGDGPAAFRGTLRRTMKLATHETGHNLTMQHCTAHSCNMNGSNNLPETDRSPVWLCPQCLAKLIHATGADPATRFESLRAFCARHGLEEEEAYYTKALAALGG